MSPNITRNRDNRCRPISQGSFIRINWFRSHILYTNSHSVVLKTFFFCKKNVFSYKNRRLKKLLFFYSGCQSFLSKINLFRNIKPESPIDPKRTHIKQLENALVWFFIILTKISNFEGGGALSNCSRQLHRSTHSSTLNVKERFYLLRCTMSCSTQVEETGTYTAAKR